MNTAHRFGLFLQHFFRHVEQLFNTKFQVMKKCLVFYPASIMVMLCVVFVQCRKSDSPPNYSDLWQKLNTPYFDKPLDIQFTSADTGYILGAKYSDDSIYNILIKTFDGGKTWQSIAFTDHKFLTDTSNGLMGSIYVFPFNSNIIFSGGNSLIRSTDGGRNWKILGSIMTTSFPVYFFDPLNGLGVTAWGTSITSDGGATWQKILNGPSSTNKLQFTSRETGYAGMGATFTGIAGGFFSSGSILKTDDGGNTWTSLSYPGFNPGNGGPGVFGLNFSNDNTGFIYVVIGDNSPTPNNQIIYKTNDGGINWTVVNSDMQSKYGWVVDFYMKNETDGFLSSEKGIFSTTDGCETWQLEHATPVSLTSFPDSHNGYAVGTDGAVYRRSF